ncbi:UDP-N-acetylmuramate dehydrogenase [Actinoplanes siamensis]|uniref:UDP-N-acetylmuramate dehydrogenase n=1 Tax=Actinoplanes siamensis TaxID=1223317 RepID=UPI001940798A|nr:UDP-N-acetylmuramate dehydrogenase [Actinoplanes siamensis]
MPDAFADHLTDTTPPDTTPADTTPATDRVLAAYTTLRLGGPAGTLTTAADTAEAVEAVRRATVEGRPVLVLAGGSNVVVGDAGFAGEVILLRNRGVEVISEGAGEVVVRVASGEPWDDLVAYAVSSGWSGVECLSGIPGSAGATPIQNVGAYGSEVAHTIAAVHAYDRIEDRQLGMAPEQCGFGYRSSVFKHNDRYLVTAVDFRLTRQDLSSPIRYAELARQLGVEAGDRVPLEQARQTVLKLRAGKGMVLDPEDRDTWSVGSFFTNPVVPAGFFAELTAERGEMPHWPGADGTVKIPAAWLIEHAGFPKGFAGVGVSISTKHTLALTNRGAGDTAALLDLARTIRDGVRDRFGVELHPEPVLVNCQI